MFKPSKTKLVSGIIIAGLLFLSGNFFSCRHEPVIPAETVSFQTSILPVITANCTQSDCHSAGSDAGPLLSYDDGIQFVVAGKPHQSTLYKVITSQSPGTVMPVPPMTPLDNASIENIYIWILQGAQNN